jgi:hypothetical protein
LAVERIGKALKELEVEGGRGGKGMRDLCLRGDREKTGD